jgi:hypothetical protein
MSDVTIPLGDEIANAAAAGLAPWDQLADHERFYFSDAHGAKMPVEAQLWMPPLSCGLWISAE